MLSKIVIRIFCITVLFTLASVSHVPAQDSSQLYHYRAIVTSVYDGDTVTADVDLGFDVWLRGITLRLNNIDAPELRGPNREAAITARNFLRQRLLGRTVIVKTLKDRKGKYGRYLAEIWLDNENINLRLVQDGLATARAY